MLRSASVAGPDVHPLQMRRTMTCTGGRLAAFAEMDAQLSVPRDVYRSVQREAMFGWFKPKDESLGYFDVFDEYAFSLPRSVFFRVPHGILRDAEVQTDNEDVPTGIPILHHLFYQYDAEWQLHESRVSVWLHSATATLGVGGDVLFLLDLSEWDDGWMLTICHTKDVTENQFRDLLSQTVAHVSAIPMVIDVRWFPDDLLQCGVFHDGDFERGLASPFDDATEI
ncbi:hypothetical protein RRSWK_06628 [Rhodopirellula sp. SWK7]|nr:hypothetical protein RRSWK_06628 [Rhodopirellula sp. SWK7]